MDELKTKICTKCGEEKILTEFQKYRKNSNEYQAWCKSCFNSWRSNYRKNNPEKRRLEKQKYVENNRDKVNAYKRRKWNEKSDEINAKRRYRRKNDNEHRKELLSQAKEYRKRNRKQVIEGKKRWKKSSVMELKDSYVKDIIRLIYGIPHSECNSELVRIKRISMIYNRQLKQLKQLKKETK